MATFPEASSTGQFFQSCAWNLQKTLFRGQKCQNIWTSWPDRPLLWAYESTSEVIFVSTHFQIYIVNNFCQLNHFFLKVSIKLIKLLEHLPFSKVGTIRSQLWSVSWHLISCWCVFIFKRLMDDCWLERFFSCDLRNRQIVKYLLSFSIK